MSDATYQVLARKYRPSDFNTLIGQDAMVRTLKNAIDSDRLAHAFVLTGVRGVGKTTTARIIAKGLNCQNRDGPSVDPCGTCDSCTAIAESRHVDVLEMDAASRTGIDDIREIIDSVRYAPVSARYKIYIIDEVHMLSNQAFNGLLKTLEEPPPHVKFLFATTEIRKLPVTVLSRCQRFDLRRVEMPVLMAHLASILEKENVTADDDALAMIARAAEGSVRDSLSLLDQAISHGGGSVSADQVADMLGYADRAQVRTLFEKVMGGDVAGALTGLRGLYDRGADPAVIVSDLMDLTHALTRVRVAPDAMGQDAMSDAEKEQLSQMAQKLGMPVLTRAWQILLKGLGEVRGAPRPIAAAEMLLVRLAHAADLPDPATLVKQLSGGEMSNSAASRSPSGGSAPSAGPAASAQAPKMTAPSAPTAEASPHGKVVALRQAKSDDTATQHPMPVTFEAMVALFKQEKEAQLAIMFSDLVRPVSYRPGHVELALVDGAQPDPTFLTRAKRCLSVWTGADWIFTLTRDAQGAGQSIKEKADAEKAALRQQAQKDPLAAVLLSHWPEAELVAVRDFSAADDADPPAPEDDEAPAFTDDILAGEDDFEF